MNARGNTWTSSLQEPNKADRNYSESAQIPVNRAKKGQARGEAKIDKGERLIKRGEMLSARIKNRKG